MGRSAEGFTRKRFSNLCVQRRVTTTMCPYVPSNGWRLSGEGGEADRVRCSRRLGADFILHIFTETASRPDSDKGTPDRIQRDLKESGST